MSKSVGEDFTREETVFWSIYAAVISVCHISIVIFLSKQTRKEINWVFLGSLTFTWSYSVLIPALIVVFMVYWHKSTKSSTTDMIAITKEVLQHNDINKVQPLVDQNFTIYFRDCGGQPEFHEVLPALVSQSTSFFLVFNLSEHLDTKYKVTYKTSNGEVSDPYVSIFTVKEALLQCLASIRSIGSYSKPQTNWPKLLFMWLWKKLTQLWKKNVKAIVSKVIIIGTHKDLLGDTGEADDVIL